jgi:hypothetical protein
MLACAYDSGLRRDLRDASSCTRLLSPSHRKHCKCFVFRSPRLCLLGNSPAGNSVGTGAVPGASDETIFLVVTWGCGVLVSKVMMRRVLSSFLLGVLVWSFVAPLDLALSTNTPALCCRRDGKHHCMSGSFSMAAGGDQQLGLRSRPSRCPYRSHPATTTVVVGLEASRNTAHYSHSEILAVRTDTLVVNSGSHSGITERGPPSGFLHG